MRIELACHTGYSRKSGIGTAEDWIRFACDQGIDTLVITERGNVDSYIAFQREIQRKGLNIKLIMGCDLLVTDDRPEDNGSHHSGRLSVLVQNDAGRRSLYRIFSEVSYNMMFDPEPVIPLSLLLQHREGLLIGSGTENSLLINSGTETDANISDTDNLRKALTEILDYVEIPCREVSVETIERLIRFGDLHKIPAVAVSAPHYRIPEEKTAYSLLNLSEEAHDRHYCSTEELLERMSFLGSEKAQELVVSNSRKIADLCEAVPHLRDKEFYPYIPDQDEKLRDLCEKMLPIKYPEATQEIWERLDWELESIKNTRSAFVFLELLPLFSEGGFRPCDISFCDTMNSSFVAFLLGFTEVDPVKEALSPYFLYGFSGEKVPSVDLSVRPSQWKKVKEMLKKALGVGRIMETGNSRYFSDSEIERLIWDLHLPEEEQRITTRALQSCVRHVRGLPYIIIIVPEGCENAEILPLARANDLRRPLASVSMFEFCELIDYVYMIDIRTDDLQEELQKLSELTGTDLQDIHMDDPEVMKLFQHRGSAFFPACVGIPGLTSDAVLTALEIVWLEDFHDLVRLLGLLHGARTWTDNAESLIYNNIAELSDTPEFSEIPAFREDLFTALTGYGISEEDASMITETVRKGKAGHSQKNDSQWAQWKEIMIDYSVPEWLIGYYEKVSYMLPKARGYTMALPIYRAAWFKLHYPLEYYLVLLEERYRYGFIPKYMACGKEKMDHFIGRLFCGHADEAEDTEDIRDTCLLLQDFYSHGFSFKFIEFNEENDRYFCKLSENTIGVNLEKDWK